MNKKLLSVILIAVMPFGISGCSLSGNKATHNNTVKTESKNYQQFEVTQPNYQQKQTQDDEVKRVEQNKSTDLDSLEQDLDTLDKSLDVDLNVEDLQ